MTEWYSQNHTRPLFFPQHQEESGALFYSWVTGALLARLEPLTFVWEMSSLTSAPLRHPECSLANPCSLSCLGDDTVVERSTILYGFCCSQEAKWFAGHEVNLSKIHQLYGKKLRFTWPPAVDSGDLKNIHVTELEESWISCEFVEKQKKKDNFVSYFCIFHSRTEKDEAFVTLATNDTYALGCLVLANSLRRVGTSRQLVVMITQGVSSSLRFLWMWMLCVIEFVAFVLKAASLH